MLLFLLFSVVVAAAVAFLLNAISTDGLVPSICIGVGVGAVLLFLLRIFHGFWLIGVLLALVAAAFALFLLARGFVMGWNTLAVLAVIAVGIAIAGSNVIGNGLIGTKAEAAAPTVAAQAASSEAEMESVDTTDSILKTILSRLDALEGKVDGLDAKVESKADKTVLDFNSWQIAANGEPGCRLLSAEELQRVSAAATAAEKADAVMQDISFADGVRKNPQLLAAYYTWLCEPVWYSDAEKMGWTLEQKSSELALQLQSSLDERAWQSYLATVRPVLQTAELKTLPKGTKVVTLYQQSFAEPKVPKLFYKVETLPQDTQVLAVNVPVVATMDKTAGVATEYKEAYINLQCGNPMFVVGSDKVAAVKTTAKKAASTAKNTTTKIVNKTKTVVQEKVKEVPVIQEVTKEVPVVQEKIVETIKEVPVVVTEIKEKVVYKDRDKPDPVTPSGTGCDTSEVKKSSVSPSSKGGYSENANKDAGHTGYGTSGTNPGTGAGVKTDRNGNSVSAGTSTTSASSSSSATSSSGKNYSAGSSSSGTANQNSSGNGSSGGSSSASTSTSTSKSSGGIDISNEDF